jgi:hypothetical protein
MRDATERANNMNTPDEVRLYGKTMMLVADMLESEHRFKMNCEPINDGMVPCHVEVDFLIPAGSRPCFEKRFESTGLTNVKIREFVCDR